MTQGKALRALGALLVFAFVPTAALCAEVETQPAANAQPAASSARPSLSDNPTLQEYLDYAAANNPGLLAARYRHLAAAERPAQETSLSDPQLTYKYALQSDTEQQSVTVEQMLPWPGKLSLRGQAAQDMSRAEFHRYKAAALETAFGVKEAYYEYYYLGRAIAVTTDNVELMKYIQDVTLTRYAASVGSHPDVIRAQIELAKMENELRMLSDMKASAAARLNAAISRPAGEERPFPTGITEAALGDTDDGLLARLSKGNPMLAAMEAEIAAAEKQVEMARKEFLPDFVVGAEWKDMKMPGAEDDFMLMAGITLPLWRSRLHSALAEARYQRTAFAGERDEKANELSAELKMAAFKYRDAARRLGLYRDALVPKAVESLKALQASYQAGSAMFLDLVEAQRTLLEFQLQYQRALTDKAISLAEIEMLAGGEPGAARMNDASAASQGGAVKESK